MNRVFASAMMFLAGCGAVEIEPAPTVPVSVPPPVVEPAPEVSHYFERKLEFAGKPSELKISNLGTEPVKTPRVIFGPDTYDAARLVAELTEGLDVQGRALALFDFVADGTFHFCYAGSGITRPLHFLDLYNSYGFGCCGQTTSALRTLFNAAKIPSRAVDVHGLHVMAEAFYEGEWHLFDADQELVYFDGQKIASFEGIRENPALIISDGEYKSSVELQEIFLADSFGYSEAAAVEEDHHSFDFFLHPEESIAFLSGSQDLEGPALWNDQTNIPQFSGPFAEGNLKQVFRPGDGRSPENFCSKSGAALPLIIEFPFPLQRGTIRVPLPTDWSGTVAGYFETHLVQASLTAVREEDGAYLNMNEALSMVPNVDPGFAIDGVHPHEEIKLTLYLRGEETCLEKIEVDWLFSASSALFAEGPARYVDESAAREVSIVIDGQEIRVD